MYNIYKNPFFISDSGFWIVYILIKTTSFLTLETFDFLSFSVPDILIKVRIDINILTVFIS